MEEIEFTKERMSVSFSFSKMMIDPKITITPIDDDYIRGTLTARLDTFIAGHTSDKISICRTVPRPKFLDWLLRREKSYYWEIDVKDYLLNPPPVNYPTIRLYNTREIDDYRPEKII